METERINAIVVAGGVLERDGKYLLMQEAKAKCRGLWNLPAGHLEIGEDIFAGAKREILEESGCEVELTGVCQIGNRKRKDEVFVSVIFAAKVIRENAYTLNSKEVMDVKWFSYEEIVAMMDKLRNPDLSLGAISNLRQGIVAPLELVKLYRKGAEFQTVMVD